MIIIHKLYTKSPDDPWTTVFGSVNDPTGGRIIGDTDSRDVLKAGSEKSKTVYQILSPYQALIGLFKGPDNSGDYLGYERVYIDDNTLSSFWVFDANESTDAFEFATSFRNAISDMEVPAIKNMRDYIQARTENPTSYDISWVVQTKDDYILSLDGKPPCPSNIVAILIEGVNRIREVLSE